MSPLATSALGEGWGEVGDDPPAGGGGVFLITHQINNSLLNYKLFLDQRFIFLNRYLFGNNL